MPPPYRVTDTDPEVIPFLTKPALTWPVSNDRPSDRLDVMSTTLTRTRSLPSTPSPTIDLTALSDDHSVPSHDDPPQDFDTDDAATPSPAPCIVTLEDPVDARFAADIPESWRSVDTARDTLPAAPPAVKNSRWLLPTLCDATQLSVESLTQPVCSHTVCDVDADMLPMDLPILAPWTLSTADPVTGTLDRRIVLNPLISPDRLAVKLPSLTPIVSTPRILPPTPWTPLHSIDVSDSQLDISQPDSPDKAEGVCDARPTLAPLSVRLLDPVPALFERRPLITLAASIVILSDKLPLRSPAVIVISLEAPADPDDLEHTVVSDTQTVPSAPVTPTPPRLLTADTIIPAPLIVMLIEPDAAEFTIDGLVTREPSPEKPLVVLPHTDPAVMAIRPDLCCSAPALDKCIDVADTHTVRSHTVSVNVSPAVMLYSAKPPPKTVMLSAPDAALFAWTKVLVRAVSQESICVALPVLMPAVTTRYELAKLLRPCRHRAVESDTQLVPSQLVTTLEAR